MDLLYLLLVLILIITITYWFLTRPYDYWAKQNVPIISNPIPGFGHMWPIFTLKKNLSVFCTEAYNSTNASAIGFYFLREPALIPRDPELIKCVLQTNFNSFHSNGMHVDVKADPVLAKNPFFATDLETWKITRTRTTSHLSGTKLKYLSVIAQDVCSKMEEFMERKIKENNGSFECELKEHFLRYTSEIIANAAFRIEGQNFTEKPDRLSFTNVAKNLFAPTLINGIKQALLFYLPSVGNSLGISLLAKSTDTFFRENIKAILKQRKQTNSTTKDYLQFSLDANSEGDIDSIIADVIIFYGDVYETSSTTIAEVFYYLSENQHVQEKLRDHIASVLKETHGIATYESLKNMNYLDQVIFETMRLLPPLGFQFKECNEEITLTGSDGLKYHLKPGHRVFVPVAALHQDSKYWSDPEVFNPDRFSPDNTADRNKFVFLPFGEGPRMCLGMRLGMMLVKLAVISVITKYSIQFSQKTKKPFEYDPNSAITYIKGGLWGRFEKLDQNK